MKVNNKPDPGVLKPKSAADIITASLEAKKNTGYKIQNESTQDIWSSGVVWEPQKDDTTEDLWEPVDWDSIYTVEVTKEAKSKAIDWQSKLDEMRNDMRTLREGLERAKELGEGAAEAWKEKIKCLQIAMRIMSGSKVPEADHRFLQDKDPELYGKAITMRMEKVDPKEHDRLSEDEEDEGIVRDPESVDTSSSGAEESADVEAAAPESDAG